VNKQQEIKPIVRFPPYRDQRKKIEKHVVFVGNVIRITEAIILVGIVLPEFFFVLRKLIPSNIPLYRIIIDIAFMCWVIICWEYMVRDGFHNKFKYISEINPDGIYLWRLAFLMKKVFIPRETILRIEFRSGMFYRKPFPRIWIYLKDGRIIKDVTFLDQRLPDGGDEAFWSKRVDELRSVCEKVNIEFKHTIVSEKTRKRGKQIGSKK